MPRLLLAGLLVLCAVTPFSSPAASASASTSSPPSLLVDDGSWSDMGSWAAGPGARREVAAAYDPVTDRMILYGGVPHTSATWAVTVGGTVTWSQIPTVHVPGKRIGATMVYDAARRRMVLLFGHDEQVYYNDVWVLNLDGTPNWTRLSTPTAPQHRSHGFVFYDEAGDRIISFGGFPAPYADMWELDLATGTWSSIPMDQPAPAGRWGGTGCFDAPLNRLIVTLGSTSSSYAFTGQTWAFSFDTGRWALLSTDGPSRALNPGILDAARRRLVFHGGYNGADLSPASDTWALDIDTGAWSALAPTGTPPTPRWSHSVIHRAPSDQMVLYGGWSGGYSPSGYLATAHRLTFPPVTPAAPAITRFSPGGGDVGDRVHVLGHHLAGATTVQFNGVNATILASSHSMITTEVPAGATTGPIRVVTPEGEDTSDGSFTVAAGPEIISATPDSGRTGTVVTIHGENFTGATRVSFGGGASNAAFSVLSDASIEATVDSLAVTGPIVVTTPVGSGSSDFDFIVIPPRHRPTLVSVRDIANDQGGKVAVKWNASDYDDPRYRLITGYRVWRRAPAGAPAARALPAAQRPPGTADTDYWESVAELPAVQLDGYAYTAATPQDSMAGSNPYTAFFVQALTADRFAFYNSNVDSGYSVDNLSPPAPVPFAAVYEGTGNALHWTPSRAADFREFRLHRGSSVDFVPGEANLVIATRDTGHVDRPGPYVYKLTAVDLHGNRSPYAVVSPEAPVAALASLASIETAPGRIRLAWFAGVTDLPAATVYRRTAETAWGAVATLRPDGAGYLRHDDGEVIHGTRYGYRLGFVIEGEETFSGEGWATADAMLADAARIRPNPSRGGPLTCEFVLAAAGPATLELFDVLGRRQSFLDVAGFGAGRHSVTLPTPGPLAPGVYVLRFTARGSVHTARTVVIE